MSFDEQPATRKKIAWYTVAPHLAILITLFVLTWRLFLPNDFRHASIYGTLLYLFYSFGSKSFLLRHHQRGIYLTKLGSFQDAIAAFGLSYEFLEKYPWLDKYRCVTLLDSSAISYREMALVNIAYARAQLNQVAASLADYRRVLEQFPESKMAKEGVEYIQGRLA
jgi:tetratricopeptide (TPR) repeat protein